MPDIVLAALMFPALFLLVFLGLPVSFSLIGIAFVFGAITFGDRVDIQLFNAVLTVTSKYVLSAVPPFIMMGAILERSGIAERLYTALQLWVGRMPGGLAVATIGISTIFAAATGIVGAVEVVVGLMAIPAMMKYQYDKGLISGTICAGGSLGTIIPPSIVCIIYASIGGVSVGGLFAGILIPGLLMSGLFVAYMIGRCILRPDDGPRMQRSSEDVPLLTKLMKTATALVPGLTLIVAVVGSIIFGVASPTEAASVGVAGAMILALAYREMRLQMLVEALRKTIKVNAMILLIVLGGTMFTNVFIVQGGGDLVREMADAFNLTPMGLVVLLLCLTFILGFVLDWISILLIALPIFLPLINDASIDPMWFAVTMLIVIQTSYLTPPMAPSIFYLRGVSPPEITYRDMYRGVVPFIVCQLIVLACVFAFPQIATYLPNQIRGL